MILVLIVLAALWTPVTQTIDRYEAAQTLVVPAHVENAFLIAKPSQKPGPAWMFPFFNKDVSQLTLDEGVLLAAMHVSPNVLSPVHHPERAFARRDQLLRAMLDARMISKRDLDAALGQRTIPR